MLPSDFAKMQAQLNRIEALLERLLEKCENEEYEDKRSSSTE
jgi:hypothetical protein